MKINKYLATAVGILSASALGVTLVQTGASARSTVPIHQSGLAEGYGQGYGMRPGMMGGGMMGGGMMTPQNGNGQPDQMHVNPARADTLFGYIRDQNLTCMQCHSISGRGSGPPFSLVASYYQYRPDAEQILANHIAQGYGRMPQGLANKSQAARLAELILDLGEGNHSGSTE